MIYRLWTGRYIDLARLVSVSEVRVAGRPDYAQIELHFQLMDKPVTVTSTPLIDVNLPEEQAYDGRGGNARGPWINAVNKERNKLLLAWKESML